MPNEECPECVRLWSELANAALECARLENKLKLAVLKHHPAEVGELQAQFQAADHNREAARAEFTQHQAKVHCMKASA